MVRFDLLFLTLFIQYERMHHRSVRRQNVRMLMQNLEDFSAQYPSSAKQASDQAKTSVGKPTATQACRSTCPKWPLCQQQQQPSKRATASTVLGNIARSFIILTGSQAAQTLVWDHALITRLGCSHIGFPGTQTCSNCEPVATVNFPRPPPQPFCRVCNHCVGSRVGSMYLHRLVMCAGIVMVEGL